MKDAIDRAIEWENNNLESATLSTAKGHWNTLTVKEALTRPDLQEMLIRYSNGRQLYFSDELTMPQLYQEIDKYVIEEATALINRDFAPPPPLNPVFSNDEIKELTAGNPRLLSNLGKAVKTLQDDPFANMALREYLPALVALENKKKPDFDLQYAKNNEAFFIIYEWIVSGKERGHMVHMTDAARTHGQYLDYKLVGDKPSLLWVDCWKFEEDFGTFFDFKDPLKTLSKDTGKEIYYGGVELRNQSVNHGCPIFALNAAKQVYKDKTGLDAIHEKNVKNQSADRKLQVDAILPSHFMKHTQSSHRMYDYIRSNEEALTASVNLKGETIDQYRTSHYRYHKSDDTAHMRSIFQKRAHYLTELNDAFGLEP